jgi:hypothetical protein
MSGRVGEGKTVSPMLHSFAPSPRAPSSHILQADAVQLTLGHDGIWHAPGTPEPNTSFTRPSRHSPFQSPRLSPFVALRYAPTGRLQASPLTPGLMLDIYV